MGGKDLKRGTDNQIIKGRIPWLRAQNGIVNSFVVLYIESPKKGGTQEKEQRDIKNEKQKEGDKGNLRNKQRIDYDKNISTVEELFSNITDW